MGVYSIPKEERRKLLQRPAGSRGAPAANDGSLDVLYAILCDFSAFWKLAVGDNNIKNTRKYNWGS